MVFQFGFEHGVSLLPNHRGLGSCHLISAISQLICQFSQVSPLSSSSREDEVRQADTGHMFYGRTSVEVNLSFHWLQREYE